MASLTGNQINNTYQGLVKFTDNAGASGTPKDLTDGLGTGLPIALATNRVNFTDTVDFTGTTSVLGITSSVNTLTGGLTLAAGTNVTITDNGSDTITISASGGGGAAGLVNGVGTDSLKNADALVTNPASAPTTGSIALGDNAIIDANVSRPTWTALGHIAIGKDAHVLESSFGDVYGNANIAIGQGATVNPSYDGGSIAIGDGANTTAMHGIALGSPAQAGQFSIAIGQNVNTGSQAVSIGRNSDATATRSTAIGSTAQATGQSAVAIGDSNVASAGTINNGSVAIGSNNTSNVIGGITIGVANDLQGTNPNTIVIGNNISTPSTGNHQDTIFMGPSMSISGSTYNSFFAGLVGNISGGAHDSVALGRQFTVSSSGTTAVGRNTTCSASEATAIGAYATATASGAVAIGNTTAANANWTATQQLELTNYASLNFADDTAAATGGVPLGGIYHNAGVLRIRIS